MNHLIQKSFLGILGLGLAISSTGCMTTPGHGEIVGNTSDNVSFGGYLLDGNSWVKIQAKHPTLGWKTLGWAKSASYSFHFDGSDWYPWNTSVQIPASYWSYIGYGYYKAEVRAVQYSTNQVLPAFEAGFSEWFDFDSSVGEMWSEHGHGTEITIYGN